MKKIKKINFNKQKGFTLIELLVTMFIFVVMTGLILVKYGNFNTDTLLNNLAYDMALTIREAQTYGMNVKTASPVQNQFNYPYGVHFDGGTNTQSINKYFIFFSDIDADGVYDPGEEISRTYIKNGNYIHKVCADTSICSAKDGTGGGTLDIIFKRPDPNAIIKGTGCLSGCNYAEIYLRSKKDTVESSKRIVVRSTGQISVSSE